MPYLQESIENSAPRRQKTCLHTESSLAEEALHTKIPAFVTSIMSSHNMKYEIQECVNEGDN